MRQTFFTGFVKSIFLLSIIAAGRPQVGGPNEPSPWWKLGTLSGATSSTSAQTKKPSHHEFDLNIPPTLDKELSGSSGLPVDFDMNVAQHESATSSLGDGESSTMKTREHALRKTEPWQRHLLNMPMTLSEHQQSRLQRWSVSLSTGIPESASAFVLESASVSQEQSKEQLGKSRGRYDAGASTSSAEGLHSGKSAVKTRKPSPRYDPHRMIYQNDFFEFHTYEYDHPGLRHLMIPARRPKKLDGRLLSLRGFQKVYRPEPQILYAVENYVHNRIGNPGVLVRLLNRPSMAYGRFLQPPLIKVNRPYEFEHVRSLPIFAHDDFLSIHPGAMDRVSSALGSLRVHPKKIHFLNIRVSNEDHHIMIVPQTKRLPINGAKVDGVMFHFWEGLAPVGYESDFPVIRAYLGAMVLNANPFDSWTDIQSVDTSDLLHKTVHT